MLAQAHHDPYDLHHRNGHRRHPLRHAPRHRGRGGAYAVSASSSRAAPAIASAVMPSFSMTSGPGALAPKRSIDTDRSTQRSQPIEKPASTATDGISGDRTSARYPSS